jgi:hypothetical protein
MHTTTTTVDTRRAERRMLRFNNIDQVLLEVDRCAEADRAGRLGRVGNWTLGQTLGHLAAWVDFGYDGCPITPPWFIRMICRVFKNKFLNGPMQAGFRMSNVEAGTLATDVLPLDEGLERYRRALGRLRAAPPDRPNVVFGPLTHDQWIALHLRHGELHLGFMVPS